MMGSKLHDCLTQILALDEGSADIRTKGDNTLYRISLAHLFSLMHALAILEIKGEALDGLTSERHEPVSTCRSTLVALFPYLGALCSSKRSQQGTSTRVLVLGGVHPTELDRLRVLRPSAWLSSVGLRLAYTAERRALRHKLDQSIVSRILSELGDGLGHCAAAKTVSTVQVPYPLFELMRVSKYLIIGLIPTVMLTFTSSLITACLACFVGATLLVAIHEVSEEMEEPCGGDANDLPLLEMHEEFNEVTFALASQRPAELDEFGDVQAAAIQVSARAHARERDSRFRAPDALCPTARAAAPQSLTATRNARDGLLARRR
jgi:hypothetical protein